jgi:Holliday junction resolvase
MPNPQKRKGTSWESAIVAFLRERGIDAVRVAQTGVKDTGDIHAGEWMIEAKNARSIDLAAFCDQTENERQNSGKTYGVVVVKRRNHGAAKGYAVMTLETLARIMKG